MVAPGTPLLRVEQAGGSRLDVRVDESRAAFVKLGDRVPVLLDRRDGTGQSEVSATVQEIARAIDADTRAVLVKLALSDPGATSGAFGRARLPGASRKALVVPASAVRRQGQVAMVFAAEGDKARLRMVQLGKVNDGLVEVVSGLSDGEQVVEVPPPDLVDGQALRVTGTTKTAPAGGGR